MRTFSRLALLAIFALFVAPFGGSAYAAVPATFTFQGAGYGHGVGMSQFGALGQSLQGKTAMDILRYYYSMVTVEPVVDSQMMRVNIGHLLSSFSVTTSSKVGQIQIYAGDVKDNPTAQPISVLPLRASIGFTALGNVAFPSVTTSSGQVTPLASGSLWTIRWTGTRYLAGDPAVVSVKTGTSSTKYRYGQIQVKMVKAPVLGYRLEVTNTVRLHDEYLWGIGEMPSAWPAAAIQAQAIASRTFALARGSTVRTACDCNIYSSSQDQAFVGYAKETEAKYGALWKAAVNATSTDANTGLAILFGTSPISAFFFSSSGGNTEAAQNVWGTAVPYATGVPDPWSLDKKINPSYASWTRSFTQSAVASAFGLADVATLFVNGKDSAGRVTSVTATSSAGATAKLTGGAFANKINLPSAWFDVTATQVVIPGPTPTATPLPSPAATP